MALSILEVLNELFPTEGQEKEERSDCISWVPSFYPKIDVSERSDGQDGGTTEVSLVAELPGIKKEDITLELIKKPNGSNYLTISGEKVREKEEKTTSYVSQERTFGKFQRCIKVSQELQLSDIRANFDNGVLTVIYPKTKANKEDQISKVTIA
jgi:HSP20 family molecular chaperone IbpA